MNIKHLQRIIEKMSEPAAPVTPFQDA